jgi:hypothetical protein
MAVPVHGSDQRAMTPAANTPGALDQRTEQSGEVDG